MSRCSYIADSRFVKWWSIKCSASSRAAIAPFTSATLDGGTGRTSRATSRLRCAMYSWRSLCASFVAVFSVVSLVWNP